GRRRRTRERDRPLRRRAALLPDVPGHPRGRGAQAGGPRLLRRAAGQDPGTGTARPPRGQDGGAPRGEWRVIKVCPVDEIEPGTAISVEADDLRIAVVRCEDGSVHAIYDECSHAAVPLSEGEIDDCTLECWLH